MKELRKILQVVTFTLFETLYYINQLLLCIDLTRIRINVTY